MISFDYPWMFALILLPWVIWRFSPAHHETQPSLRVPFVSILENLTGRNASEGSAVPRATNIQRILTVVSWLLIVTAIARPQWIGEAQSKTIASRDLLLAVDLSTSMEEKDFLAPDGEQIDRLSAVKMVLDEFLTRREGDRVGLILFGSSAFVQTPFTEDIEACRTLLGEAQIGMAGPKTMIGDAIGLGISVFEKSDLEERALILLTDGNDSGSKVPPENAARIAVDYGITIHTIAVGSLEATGNNTIDEDALREVATITGGGFYRASSREELEQIYARIDALKASDSEVLTHRSTSELYVWPLGVALCLTLGFHLLMAMRLIKPANLATEPELKKVTT